MKYEQRRLSIHTEWKPFVESNPTALYARSLFSARYGHWNDTIEASFFMKLKFLRVLDLEYGVLFGGFPEEIISLIHLRYLAIRGSLVLPENIENLHNLKVLRVLGLRCLFVSTTIWKMERLRHICLQRPASFFIDNFVPEDVQLNNVDTLSFLRLHCNIYGEQLLRRFPKVRNLSFELREEDGRFLQCPALDFLSNLESLNVDCPMGLYLPSDFKFPATLKKLTLTRSRLPWSEISAIGKLPNLKVLKLRSNAFKGFTWDMKDKEFLNLKFLELARTNIQQWNACDNPFPCLQRLVLLGCYRLQEIPSNFGNISTLHLIEVRGCSEGAESSAKEILNEQQEMGNDGFEVLIISQ